MYTDEQVRNVAISLRRERRKLEKELESIRLQEERLKLHCSHTSTLSTLVGPECINCGKILEEAPTHPECSHPVLHREQIVAPALGQPHRVTFRCGLCGDMLPCNHKRSKIIERDTTGEGSHLMECKECHARFRL